MELVNDKKLIINNVEIRDYLIVCLFFICSFISLTLDSENSIFTIDNVSFQIKLLLIIVFVLNILLLYFKQQLIVILSSIIYYIIIALLIRLYVGSVVFRLWLAAAFFYTAAHKFNLMTGLIVSILFYTHLVFLQSNSTLYGVQIENMSQLNVWFLFSGQCVLLLLSQMKRYCYRKIAICMNDLDLKEKSINFLSETNMGFQEYATKIDYESRLAERLNITREIHDITGYTLTSISMMLENCEDLLYSKKEEELLQLLATARQQARKGHSEIRLALRQLREIREQRIPFQNRIHEIITNFRKMTNIDIDLELTNLAEQSTKKYEHLIIRFLQEALTNAFRHGHATRVRILFFQTETKIIINVYDNGIGSSQIVEGLGLKGMSERIKNMGGFLEYDSSLDGFSLNAHLPLITDEESYE